MHTRMHTHTGANNKFQLCFLNLHAAAGAPLLYSTVEGLAAIGATRLPVTDGPDCVAGGAEPGEVSIEDIDLIACVECKLRACLH